MPKKTVDVFDGAGAKLFSYSIALEAGDCLDAEFEQLALIFAESSGLVTADEIVHLRACCDTHPAPDDVVEQVGATARPKRQKNTVVSLVKHRMKRANSVAERSRIQRIS